MASKDSFLRSLQCTSHYETLATTDHGATRVAGVDECARGNLFGPTVAAAVILPTELPETLQGKLRDSKLLAPNKRSRLAEDIKASAIAWNIVEVGPEVIDRITIRNAVEIAMLDAVHGLDPIPDFLLIDGMNVEIPLPQIAIEHGDALSISIAAASILAKTYHTERMLTLDAEYPGYGLAKHKGYGTAEHMEALARLGPTRLHRKSFAPVRALL
jgi:ribonuclease HII